MPELDRDSQSWNFADPYTKLVFQGFVDMEYYVTIAIYGIDDMKDDYFVSQEVKKRNRINAINRLIDCERKIFEAAKFQCNKKKETKLMHKVLKSKLASVMRVIDGIMTQKRDERNNTQTININEKHFNLCLEVLRSIKEELPVLLDKAGMVYPTSEEVDLEKLKESLKHGA